jgi:hypothetical protein
MHADAIPFSKPGDRGVGVATREFRRVDDGRYVLTLLEVGIEFEIDRLRRRWDELIGELTVRCELAGARTFEGLLSAADLNLSSAKARQDRGKLLAQKSRAAEIPWSDLLDEFAQRVTLAERTGRPVVLLRELPRAERDENFSVNGFPLLRRHPVVLFGDGGAAKSYFGLYLAGELERSGTRTLYVDYEFAGEDHRERLECLYSAEMPSVRYLRADRPLVHEIDHLRRIVRDEGIVYAVLDSIAFACHGKPEDADVAAAYFRCLRQLGVGTLNIAHVPKGDNQDQRPFGSAFWHNGCRSSWFAKRAGESTDGQEVTIGLFHRKNNVGRLHQPFGFQFRFDASQTRVTRVDLADVPQLADQLSISQRIRHLLRSGAMTYAAIAEELGEKPNTITQTVKRGKGKVFTIVLGADGIHRIGLLERAS